MPPPRPRFDRIDLLLGCLLVALLTVPVWTLTQARRPLTFCANAKGSVSEAEKETHDWPSVDSADLQSADGTNRPDLSAPVIASNIDGASSSRRLSNPRQELRQRRNRVYLESTTEDEIDRINSGTSQPSGLRSLEQFARWLDELDTDHDGQISLQEWRAGGRPLRLFQEMDRNQDGFLTAPEALSFAGKRQERPQQPDLAYSRSSGGIQVDFTVERQDSAYGRPFNVGPFGSITKSQRPPSSSRASAVSHQVTATSRVGSPSNSMPPVKTASGITGSPPIPSYPDSLATIAIPLNDGSNAYWMEREQQNEALLLSGAHPAVLFLGDSITDWFAHGAGAAVWDNYLAPLDAADFAVSGTMTSQVLWQVETGQVAMAGPAVVVLMIGSNNLGVGQSPPAVTAGVTRIVQEIQGQLPRTKILLLGILPRRQSPSDPLRAKITQVNFSLSRLADGKRIQYVNFGSAYLQSDGSISPLLMPDYIHPSLLGYQIYTAAIWQPLLQMLGD